MSRHGQAPTAPACIRHIAGAASPPPGEYDADIVILALDRCEETLGAIRSALEQNGLSRHLFVVDQGSRPGALARLAEAVRDRNDATLVALERNHGVAGGRNIGAGLGHGRFIAGLDNDAVFAAPDTVLRMARALDANAGVAAIGCRIVADRTGTDDLTSWGYPAALLPRAAGTFLAATFVGAGHAIRRAAWSEAGGYDPALFFCWEEYDFCLRAIARGWTILYRGDIVVRHKVSPETRVRRSGGRWFHFVRNRLYIERKIGRSWWRLLPRIAAYGMKGLRNGCFAATPRAVAAAVRLSRGVVPAPLPDAARAYLARTDTAHRGGPLRRLWREVASSLPVQINPKMQAFQIKTRGE